MFETIAILFILAIASIISVATIHECSNTNKYHGFVKRKLSKMKGYKVLWGK